MKLLVVGGGGREHAIIKKLKENPEVQAIYALPGNGGIAADATCVPIGATDIEGIVKFAVEQGIDYAVVAPDDPLVLGAVDALNEAGNIDILGSFCCDNSTEQARAITTELLSEDPEIRGFVCTNEVCNVGAANALADLGMGGQVFVVGCDNSQRQIQFLEQNIIQAIVTQRPFNMGYMAVQQAVRVANGEQTDDFVEVACVLITRENMYTQENQKLLFPILR